MESILTSLLSVAAESALLPALMGAVVGDDRPQKAPTEGAHRRRPQEGEPFRSCGRPSPTTAFGCPIFSGHSGISTHNL